MTEPAAPAAAPVREGFVEPAVIDPALVERARRRVPLLFLNVFVVAICGLVYELVAGAAASYLLGDSVTQFSLVIGLYLSAMGVGAWLSKHLEAGISRRFVDVQIAIALFGGTSAPALFFAYGALPGFRALLFLEVFVIGALVGLELPLLMRILERQLAFKELVSRVLAFDYLGALAASLLFPLVLVPQLGLVRSSLVMGLANAAVALWATELLRDDMRPFVVRALRARAFVVAIILVVGIIKAGTLSSLAEERLFSDPVVFTKSTPYQRIVVTSSARGFQLYLNGNLQLDSADEYRYHEALVHPALAALGRRPARVLVLGGGDGLALRELLKAEGEGSVGAITLVDLDPGMTSLSRDFPPLADLNGRAFDDPRVRVVNEDAFVWLDERFERLAAEQRSDGRDGGAPFDLVIVDFPDPNHFALGKLYTKRFYSLLARALADDGVVAVQSTSPLAVPKSYWTIVTTMEAAGFVVKPYQVTVPSFGVWGYCLGKKSAFDVPQSLGTSVPRDKLRFLDDQTLAGLFQLAPDMRRVPAEVNRLDNQILVRTYEEEGNRWR